MRLALPNRRRQVTEIVQHAGRDYIVSFGIAPDGKVREAFCTTAAKSGTDTQAFINDSCVAISLLLQHGMTMADLAQAFGENRNEGEASGPPASPLGAVARAGAAIDGP